MSLTIINHKNHKIDNDLSIKLENAFNLIRKEENLGDCSVNLKIVDNEEMEDLNKKYRNKDASTNVLSFSNKDISLFENESTFVDASLFLYFLFKSSISSLSTIFRFTEQSPRFSSLRIKLNAFSNFIDKSLSIL